MHWGSGGSQHRQPALWAAKRRLRTLNSVSRDGADMGTFSDGRRSLAKATLRGAVWPAAASTAATVLVFLPVLLRSPSTTQAVSPVWLVALVLAAPLTAYLISRFRGMTLSVFSSLLAGLPQLPLVLLMSTVAIWLDVQRGHLMAGSGEEAMSYGLGTSIAAIIGIILMILVAAAARIGARTRKPKRELPLPAAG